MTLNVQKFMEKAITKQMAIQHYEADVKALKRDEIPEDIVQKIKAQYGDTYLEDANFVLFYKGKINGKGLEKIFNITDKALGEDANRLTQGDFKILKMDGSAATAPVEEPAEPETQPEPEAPAAEPETQPEPEEAPAAEEDTSTEDSSASEPNAEGAAPEEEPAQDATPDADDSSSEEGADDEDDAEDEKALDEEIESILGADASLAPLEEDDAEELASLPTQFFFLKITIND